MSIGENNKLYTDEEEDKEETFEFDFIDIPWDNRTKRSKIGIVVLLVSIAVVTFSCVCINLNVQRKGYLNYALHDHRKLNCHMVRVDNYKFVARIHTIKDQKAICVGLVIDETLIVTSEECVQSGPIILRVGSWSEPRCRKNFAVDVMRVGKYTNMSIPKIIMLRTLEKLGDCIITIPFGEKVNWNTTAYVIGRIMHGGKLLSRQAVTLEGSECPVEGDAILNKTSERVICVRATARCPITAGDLLVQHGKIFGLSPTTTKLNYRKKFVQFSDITQFKNLLQ